MLAAALVVPAAGSTMAALDPQTFAHLDEIRIKP
jgi:hypothetical protein